MPAQVLAFEHGTVNVFLEGSPNTLATSIKTGLWISVRPFTDRLLNALPQHGLSCLRKHLNRRRCHTYYNILSRHTVNAPKNPLQPSYPKKNNWAQRSASNPSPLQPTPSHPPTLKSMPRASPSCGADRQERSHGTFDCHSNNEATGIKGCMFLKVEEEALRPAV